MSKQKVIILGGGVAGMSAAHELIERGFDVTIFERKQKLPGGKARSVPVPDPDAPHTNPLPGEHGFRFFPGFYKHIIDTMQRIPYPGNAKGVFDNLVPAPHVMMARMGQDPIVMLDSFPKSLSELKFMMGSLHQHTGLTHDDEAFFAERVWQLMTSCKARRANDYERIGWWQFTEGAKRGKAYQDLLARGLTRTLVAARAQTASTKTGGDIFLQLIFNMANPSVATDRILNGPTNNVWLHPWLEYLKSKGVDFHFGSTVTRLNCENGSITGVEVQATGPGGDPTGPARLHVADHYILAVPIEVAAPLVIGDLLQPGQAINQFLEPIIHQAKLDDPEVSVMDVIETELEKAAIVKADRTLAGLVELASDVSWMTGVQFFLNEEVTLNDGHIIFSDSPWAVTAIAQSNFWKGFPMSSFADGKVKTVLSCDVSEWDTVGLLYGKIAKKCSPEEIKEEVWQQIQRSLVSNGKPMVNEGMIHSWFIDRDIKFMGADNFSENREPLLVNKVDTWRLRPEAYCAIPNLYFAADYVRTHTDLATMEGANEAARRAVNVILERSGSTASPCMVWDLHEPWIFQAYRKHDHERYSKGLPWHQDFPWWVRLLQKLISLFKRGAKKSA